MVRVRYQGRLGNQLFQYSLGRILAEKFCYQLVCNPLNGFEATRENIPGKTFDKITSFTGQIIDLCEIDKLRNNAGIEINGFFQRYEYYRDNKHKIRWWLNRGKTEVAVHPDDIVVHVRRTQYNGMDTTWCYRVVGDSIETEDDIFPITERSRENIKWASLNAGRDILPFEYYEGILNEIPFRRLHICTDVPDDPYLKHFDKYDPIVRRSAVMDDFNFMRCSSKLITSISTMSWWAALLSDAEVFMPYPHYGTWRTDRTGVDLRVTDDARYRVIDVKREGSFF